MVFLIGTGQDSVWATSSEKGNLTQPDPEGFYRMGSGQPISFIINKKERLPRKI